MAAQYAPISRFGMAKRKNKEAWSTSRRALATSKPTAESTDPARELRAQLLELRFERADAVEQRERNAETLSIELEIVAQAVGRSHRDDALRAEPGLRRFRIDGRDGSARGELLELAFGASRKLCELGEREIALLVQPDQLGEFDSHRRSPQA